MKIHVYLKAGSFVEFEFVNDFAFDEEDKTLVLYTDFETLIVIPRENVLFVREDYEYDKDNLN